jgi:hypothetical protein
MAIKTTWTEVNQIIKEEFQRVMEKKKIQSRIQQINEELAMMEDEDSAIMGEDALEEVEAGSEMKVRSHAWTGEKDGDTKWTPEFDHSRDPALMEDDEIEVGDDDDDTEEEGSLADEFAELGAAIEAKIMAALGRMNDEDSEEEAPEEEEAGDDGEEFEEVEVSDDDEDEDGASEEDTVEEYREVVPMGDHGVTTTHDMDQDGKEEGDKEGEMKKESMNESVSRKGKKYLNVLSEGMDSRRQSALEGEIERMRKLAKLGNND